MRARWYVNCLGLLKVKHHFKFVFPKESPMYMVHEMVEVVCLLKFLLNMLTRFLIDTIKLKLPLINKSHTLFATLVAPLVVLNLSWRHLLSIRVQTRENCMRFGSLFFFFFFGGVKKPIGKEVSVSVLRDGHVSFCALLDNGREPIRNDDSCFCCKDLLTWHVARRFCCKSLDKNLYYWFCKDGFETRNIVSKESITGH